MPRLPEPAELIEVARHLVERGTAESLRRAVSTAYYALFHCLAAHAADRFVGAGDTSAAYTMVYRSLDHTRMRSVLIELGKSRRSKTKPDYEFPVDLCFLRLSIRDQASCHTCVCNEYQHGSSGARLSYSPHNMRSTSDACCGLLIE